MAYAPKTDTPLAWTTVDLASLPQSHRKLYDGYKAAYTAASAARKLFEEQVAKDAKLPADKALVFGYRFGNLSMAVTAAKERKATGKVQSLASFLQHAH